MYNYSLTNPNLNNVNKSSESYNRIVLVDIIYIESFQFDSSESEFKTYSDYYVSFWILSVDILCIISRLLLKEEEVKNVRQRRKQRRKGRVKKKKTKKQKIKSK
eukprot:71016_1